MKLFDIFRRKKDTPVRSSYNVLEAAQVMENVDVGIDEDTETESINCVTELSEEEVTAFVKGKCQEILEASREVEKAKAEYQIITSYINDIQIIDSISEEDSNNLRDTAKKISLLKRERINYQNSPNKVNNEQYYYVEKYEAELDKIIKNLEEEEKYAESINRDMRNLDGEFTSLKFQARELREEQQKIKKNAGIGLTLVIMAAMSLMVVNIYIDINLTTMCFVLAAIASLITAYMIIRIRDIAVELKNGAIKSNRAIDLINKTKIKYVNNQNSLSYQYSKYNVKNSQELIYLYERYKEAKKEKERYEKSASDLDLLNYEIVDILDKYELYDSSVWTTQYMALMNEQEMREIIDKLGDRRKSIRSHINFNLNNASEARQSLKDYVKNNKKHGNLVLSLVKGFDLNEVS